MRIASFFTWQSQTEPAKSELFEWILTQNDAISVELWRKFFLAKWARKIVLLTECAPKNSGFTALHVFMVMTCVSLLLRVVKWHCRVIFVGGQSFDNFIVTPSLFANTALAETIHALHDETIL